MKDNHIEIKTDIDSQKYRKLSDREHILLRSATYLGSKDHVESEEYFLENEKFVTKKVEYVPGFLKIINEILDNSIDEAVRSNFKFANKIFIDITNSSVEIIDNGRGIPVEKMKGIDEYIPVVLFTEAKAGSNFEDGNRTTIGMNGLGGTITNVFSKKFKVTTYDGKKKLVLECINNNETNKFKISESNRQGTEVYFEPDLSRFGLKKIEEIYIKLIEQRLYFMSIIYPLIKFTLNKEKIKVSSIDSFIKTFSENYEIIKSENYFIALTSNETDDFKFLSFVNGILISEGGNHINYVMNEIISRMREKLIKKHPEIKPGDIKNKIRVIVFFNNFIDPKFNSQTKDTITNSISEIREYLGDINWEKLVQQILKNETIIDPIVEIYKIKEEFKKRQDLKGLSSNKKISVEKYLPPIGEKKYLTLCEGDSALSSTISILGRKEFGYFPLRGKPLNVIDGHIGKITTNEEIKNIISILGIDISKEVKEMNYENILIASDQDLDGILIRGLLLTFFYKYTPLLLKAGKIKYLKTPMIMLKKKGKIEHWFFNFNEYNKWLESNDVHEYEFSYMKGLGSWNKNDLQYIINKDGLSRLIETFELDKSAKESITYWMGSEYSDKRKEFLRGKEFNINML